MATSVRSVAGRPDSARSLRDRGASVSFSPCDQRTSPSKARNATVPGAAHVAVPSFTSTARQPALSCWRVTRWSAYAERTAYHSGLRRATGSPAALVPVSYTHLRAHETVLDLVCR